MKRRDVLTTAAIVLTGCLGGDGGDSGAETTGGRSTGSTETDPTGTTSSVTVTEAGSRDTATRTETGAETDTERATDTETTGTETETATGTRGTTAAGITSREFTVESEDGAPASEASVTFENGGSRVVVTGTITGSDGCQTATLESVQADGSGLRVTVATERAAGAGAVCSQALIGIEYRLTLTVENPPRSVRVVHRGSNGSSEVAATERDD